MLIVLLLLLVAGGGSFAAGAYILAEHGNTAAGRFLAGRLPLPVIRAMRWATDWFGDGERPPHHVTHPVSYTDGVRDDPGAPPASPSLPPLPPEAPHAPAGPAPLVAVRGGDAAFPEAWAVVPAMIATFEPGDDTEMMRMWRADAAFQVACADAWRQQFDHLVNGLGLDPAAVQGVAEYADERADSAHSANLVVQRFLAVYLEVKNYLANGGSLPHDGRFLTEEGA